MESIKNFKWSMVFMGIVTTAVGVAIVMNPQTTADTIIRIVGGILAGAGILSFLGYLLDKKKGISSYGDILVGAIVLAIGIALLISPGILAEFINIIFAIVLCMHGFVDIVEGFRSRKLEDPKWTQAILIGFVCVIIAAILFFVPFKQIYILMMIIGISLIVDGLTSIFIAGRIGIVTARFNKAAREAAEAAAKAKAEAEAEAASINAEDESETSELQKEQPKVTKEETEKIDA